MTNIVALLSVVITTNWSPVYMELPVYHNNQFQFPVNGQLVQQDTKGLPDREYVQNGQVGTIIKETYDGKKVLRTEYLGSISIKEDVGTNRINRTRNWHQHKSTRG